MTRQEMIDLVGWHYQTMTQEEQNILSRVEHIVEVAVLRERNACAQLAETAEPYQAADLIRARSNP